MLMKYKDFKMLSNEDMKQISGGNPPAAGTCCAHSSDWAEQICSISKADAIDQASIHSGWKWCCDSCPS